MTSGSQSFACEAFLLRLTLPGVGMRANAWHRLALVQRLKPGEKRDMPVVFYVDPRLLEDSIV